MKRMISVIAGMMLITIALSAKTADNRTKDQVEAVKNKTVADYFLLCPDIVPSKVFEAPDEITAVLRNSDSGSKTSDIKGENYFEYRKELLYRDTPFDSKMVIDKRIIDIPNGYIELEGHNGIHNKFHLTFAYFLGANKKAIPAWSYSFEGMEEWGSQYAFYDISGGWKVLKKNQIIPQDLFKFYADQFPALNKIDNSLISWNLVLPRYGTTAGMTLVLQTSQVDNPGIDLKEYMSLAERIGLVSLDLLWNGTNSVFTARVHPLEGVFSVRDGNLTLTRNGRTENLGRLYEGTAGPVQIDPYYSISPGSNYAVFAGYDGEKPCLFVAAKTGAVTKISGSDNIFSSPPFGPDAAWLPGEKSFVYSTGYSIFLYNIAENENTMLTDSGQTDVSPSVDKNGRIHFMRGNIFEFSFSGTEYMMNWDGSGLTKVPGGKTVKGENLKGEN